MAYIYPRPGNLSPVIPRSFWSALKVKASGIMIGRHFHANMKVQTATCKDDNNSKVEQL